MSFLPANPIGSLTPAQRKAGMAAWLGWLFDGMEGFLYVLVAAPFVGQLMHKNPQSPTVAHHSAYIQGAFLIGWALGGAVFGRIGDHIGRSRTFSLTILTYALCTGLSSFAVTWQMLLVFRFLAALGIGGEWAAGSTIIAETWPNSWRPWASSALQSAFQCGLLVAAFITTFMVGHERWVFLFGALPALLVFWFRRSLPETEEWKNASAQQKRPPLSSLFQGTTLRTTLLTIAVCSLALTITWAYIFWFPAQLMHLPDIQRWPQARKLHYVYVTTLLVNVVAIGGNFLAGALSKYVGYRRAMVIMFAGAGIFLYLTYSVPRTHVSILYWAPWAHLFVQGIFGIFPLYIPPLFPTMLRTTGAGFCYNIGRIVAGVGTIVFGVLYPVNNLSEAILAIALLTVPAMIVAAFMPELPVHTEITTS